MASADPANQANKTIIKSWKLNQLAFEVIILSVNTTIIQGTSAFHLVDNHVSRYHPYNGYYIAWKKLYKKSSQNCAILYKLIEKITNSNLAIWKIYPILQTNG